MKILVCVKQVPDMEARFSVNAAGTWIDETDLAFRMNEYDEYAVEQAVRIKEAGEADVTVLSIGPERVKETIKKALAMGGDRGVHILDDAAHEKDAFAIASLIAGYAKDKDFDLILTGMQSQDRGSGQVGVLVAEMLGLGAVTTVVEMELDGANVTVRRELEGGMKAVVKGTLPMVATCQLGLNEPRYPTLPNIMKAKKKELNTVPSADLSPEDSRMQTDAMFPPEKKGSAMIIEGDDAVDRVIELLKGKVLK